MTSHSCNITRDGVERQLVEISHCMLIEIRHLALLDASFTRTTRTLATDHWSSHQPALRRSVKFSIFIDIPVLNYTIFPTVILMQRKRIFRSSNVISDELFPGRQVYEILHFVTKN